MKTTVTFDKKTGNPKAAKLDLTKEEAQWLRALVQNPIGTDAATEDPQNAAMRRRFFTSVSDFTTGNLF